MNNQEVRELVCPKCNKKGTLRLNTITMSITCKTCGSVKVDTTPKTKTPKVSLAGMNDYPPLPKDFGFGEVITEKDATGTIEIGKIYCPKEQVSADSIFKKAEGTPEELAGQFARYLERSAKNGNYHPHFALARHEKAIANRKRYRRDLAKRQPKQGKANWPF